MAVDIKRALTDLAYRATLTPEELAQLPGAAAGDAALSESELERVAGGLHKATCSTDSTSLSACG